jgi:hypothetical protein
MKNIYCSSTNVITTTTTKDNNANKPIDCGFPIVDGVKGLCYPSIDLLLLLFIATETEMALLLLTSRVSCLVY